MAVGEASSMERPTTSDKLQSVPFSVATNGTFTVAPNMISAADDVARVEEELDFAWAGSVVEQGGMLCFRPGADGAAVATLDTSVHAPVSVESPPPVSERINSARLSLSASRLHGGGYNLPEIADTESVAADGASARHDLGEAALLSSPTASKRLLSTLLRATQTSRISRYRFEVGDTGSWLSVRPGQQVTLVDLSLRSAGASMLVVGARVVPDTDTAPAVLELELVEQEPATFRDAIDLPVSRPDLSRSDNPTVAVPRPRGLEIEERVVAADDGTVVYLLVTWAAHPFASTELQWRSTAGDTSTNWCDAWELVALGARALLSPVKVGDMYEVRLRHVSRDGMMSRWACVLSDPVEGDTSPISAPSGLEPTAMPAGLRLEWAHPVEKGYSHTEIHNDLALTPATLVGTVRGTYFEEYFKTLADPPAAREYWVRHLNRRCKASALVSVTVTPLAVVDRVGVIRDSVYLAQAPGGSPPPAPHDIEGSSGWTRKPVAPTSALPVVWQAYREANLNGEVNLAWSDWSVPELYAVENDSTVAGFTTQVDLEFRALDRVGQVVGAVSSTFIEPTADAPLVEVRQRSRASSTDTFPDWDEAEHRWTAVARRTRDGVRYGVKAELDAALEQAEGERTIYFRSASDVAPANPGGLSAVPAGWSASELAAASSERYVYRLTVRTENGAWPDWSTAGTLVPHDTWIEPAPPPVVENAIYLLAANQPVAPADTAFPPANWSATPLQEAPPLSVWRSTQELRGDIASAWSLPTLWAGTSFAFQLASSQPATPSGADFPPVGWSATELDAASSMSVWRTTLSVVEGVQGAWSVPENWEPWLLATFYRVTGDDDVPSAVPVASPQRQDTMITPTDWEPSPVYPSTHPSQYRWILRLEGPARAPAIVAGFPSNDIKYEYEPFGILHDAEIFPARPRTFDPPAGWISQTDGGLQQTPMSNQELYFSVRRGYAGDTDAAGVMYDTVLDGWDPVRLFE